MTIPFALMLLAASSSHAEGLRVTGAWARAAPAGGVSTVYMTIVNGTPTPDVLLGLSSPATGAITLHETRRQDGVAAMRALAVLDVPAGATVRLEPLGAHAMVSGVRTPLKPGALLPVLLRFKSAGDVAVRADVKGLANSPPPSGVGHHHDAP